MAERAESRARARAAICVFIYPELDLAEEATAERAVEFPYVPGLLGFRAEPIRRGPSGRAVVEENRGACFLREARDFR
jgi:hypothetical protein